ncbi:hypothetical protein BDV98DRAFT_561628 [Pterulicium gracile]|uniref:Uncharacterized protein n=1 Tax=Pterulicium gracile TaxID=1884261 RepID=A0A5C3QUZ3_9AGAR|nr:hypothetical protein BDV98DRAFT_561628 [Pterula gracilis]
MGDVGAAVAVLSREARAGEGDSLTPRRSMNPITARCGHHPGLTTLNSLNLGHTNAPNTTPIANLCALWNPSSNTSSDEQCTNIAARLVGSSPSPSSLPSCPCPCCCWPPSCALNCP